MEKKNTTQTEAEGAKMKTYLATVQVSSEENKVLFVEAENMNSAIDKAQTAARSRYGAAMVTAIEECN